MRTMVVEDNSGDVRLIETSIAEHKLAAEYMHYSTGDMMVRALGLADVVLLDLNVPCLGDEDLLGRIRESKSLSRVPVVLVTSSRADADRIAAGVAVFIKPRTE